MASSRLPLPSVLPPFHNVPSGAPPLAPSEQGSGWESRSRWMVADAEPCCNRNPCSGGGKGGGRETESQGGWKIVHDGKSGTHMGASWGREGGRGVRAGKIWSAIRVFMRSMQEHGKQGTTEPLPARGRISGCARACAHANVPMRRRRTQWKSATHQYICCRMTNENCEEPSVVQAAHGTREQVADCSADSRFERGSALVSRVLRKH